MLSKMSEYIDVIIPRGGKSLVKKVQDLSSVPVIGHLEGCLLYTSPSPRDRTRSRMPSSA